MNPAIRRSLASQVYWTYDAVLRRRPMLRYLREYQRQQWWSGSAIQVLQGRKLAALIEHAGREVPRFRSLFGRGGLRADDIRGAADLAALPIMTKQDVRGDYGAFIAESSIGRPIRKATGGSTGDPFQFECSEESEYRRLAVMWRGYGWAGALLGGRSAYLWSWPFAGKTGWRLWKEVAYQRFLGRTYFNIFELSPSELPRIAAAIRKLRPEVIVCYASGGAALARWMLDNDFKMSAPRGVITGAEPLYETERALMQAAFGAPVFDTYGSREVMLMASQCPEHRGMHINADHLVLETVDADGKPVCGEPGRVLVTDLHNYRMPFIRYANGDVACLDPRPCGCGRGLPLLKYVEGREVDVVRLPDGRMLTGLYFVHKLKDFSRIRYFQIIHERADCLRILIVPMQQGDRTAMPELQQALQNDLGKTVRIAIEMVDQIPLSATGKRRVVLSAVDKAGAS